MSTTEWNNIINTSTEDDSGMWVEVSTTNKKGSKKNDTRNKSNSTTNNSDVTNLTDLPSLPNISVSNGTKTNKGLKDDETPIHQIRFWASSKNPVSLMMAEYNTHKPIWERPRFVQKNLNAIIEELSRNRRWDMLLELMDKNPLFSTNLRYLHKGVSPYHKLIWPHEKHGRLFNEAYYNELVKTFDTLVAMGFDVFMDNLNVEDEYETFIGALIKSKNPINDEYKTKLYNYFTDALNHSHFNEEIVTNILNKCNNSKTINNNNFETKFNHINDKILYIIQKFGIDNTSDIRTENDQTNKKICSIQTIFNFCCTMGVDKIKKTNTWVQNVCLSILSNPKTNQDFYRYLARKDINSIKNKFIDTLINNYENWIDSWINDCMNYKNEGGEQLDDDEFEKEVKNKIIHTYANLMIMFATFYSKSYKKKEILATVQDIIENVLTRYDFDNENKVIIASYFIQNSSIRFIENITNSTDEKQFFKYLVNNFYKNEKKFLKAKTQLSICIGNIKGETSQSALNNFIIELGNEN